MQFSNGSPVLDSLQVFSEGVNFWNESPSVLRCTASFPQRGTIFNGSSPVEDSSQVFLRGGAVFKWISSCRRFTASLPQRGCNFQMYQLVFCFLFLFLILPGCSFKYYHLFSDKAQGQNVPNSLTVGMGFIAHMFPASHKQWEVAILISWQCYLEFTPPLWAIPLEIDTPSVKSLQ